MRFYELTISDPNGGQIWFPDKQGLGFVKDSASQGASFSSLYTPWVTGNAASQLNGRTNPSALQIEFDIAVGPLHTLQTQGTMHIYGLGVRAISQAWNLNPIGMQFKTWTLRGGMAQGLPLANPSQAGILAGGIIFQAFGNWQDTNQTLDLILQPGPPPTLSTAVSFNWTKGQNLTDALTQTFQQAFPNYAPTLNISQNLVAPSDQVGCYTHIGAFAKYLLGYTKQLGAQQYGSSYQGCSLLVKNNGIFAVDGQGAMAPRSHALAFPDLVGQPTWIAANQISFATVMRGDINAFDEVIFPTGVMVPYAITSPDAAFPNSPAASSTAFSGKFIVNEIHHYGNFREPEASAWSTVFTAYLPATAS